ncbi:MAG: nitroreductase family protein [Muribaculaceae bacterium]|nr:nitroreductase family protein [Muribaculaceae bacterium]
MDKFEILKDLLESNRSVRRFDSSRIISQEVIERIIDLTRYCASGRNLQPLRYRIVSDRDECEAVFPALAWAGYYKDWDGPVQGERPVAYIVQCMDTELCKNCLCDDGLQLEAITLGAAALGISGCIIKSFNKQRIVEALGIPSRYEPLYVLALGYAAEEVRIVKLGKDDDIRYYRDANDVQCVPKRALADLLI